MLLFAHVDLRAPETFGIVTDTIPVQARKNLAEISKVLTQVTSGQEFSEDNLPLVPINAFVNQLIVEFTTWLLEGTCKTKMTVDTLLIYFFEYSCGSSRRGDTIPWA